MKDNIIAIIPARMDSKRFPGKPLVDIFGMPMIGHVYHRTKMCPDLAEVFVATCDEVIKKYIESIGGKVIMTSHDHSRSTDRIAEALLLIEKNYNIEPEIVVMIQGDEPLVNHQMIANSISPMLIDPAVEIVNLMTEITEDEEIADPNSVKVVVDDNNYALYMSRSPIPYQGRGVQGLPVLKKVNIVAFKRDFLLHFAALPPTPLELVESIGMLRLLESGKRIKMVLNEIYTLSVDNPYDLELAKEKLKDDYWMQKYINK